MTRQLKHLDPELTRLIALPVGVVALWLLFDALTYSLLPADALTGRVRGCYTQVELMFGVRGPSIIRDIELCASVLLLVASATWFLVETRRRSRET